MFSFRPDPASACGCHRLGLQAESRSAVEGLAQGWRAEYTQVSRPGALGNPELS